MGDTDPNQSTALPAERRSRDGSGGHSDKPRLLLLLVIGHRASVSVSVLDRIPRTFLPDFHVEILVIDDSSNGVAVAECETAGGRERIPFPFRTLHTPERQGDGGCQKIGYHYAIDEKFDVVALVRGEGRPGPEVLARMVRLTGEGTADVVLGSRGMERGDDGRPAGIKILSWVENLLLDAGLSDMHSGHRVYAVPALRRIPFDLTTNGGNFDTEIIIQLFRAGMRIVELPVPAGSGEPLGLVAGVRAVGAALSARLTDLNIIYDRKFDCRPVHGSHAHYQLKTGYASTHTLALEAVPTGARVVDLGCAGGHFGRLLKERRQAAVIGVDVAPLDRGVTLDAFVQHDLNAPDLPVAADGVEVVTMLDVIEHLKSPEQFVDLLRDKFKFNPRVRFIVSTGNVGFILLRLLHLCGVFSYGKKGILDITHTRLFTFCTLKRLFGEAGFDLVRQEGVPAPWPLVFGDNLLGRLCLWGHSLLCRVWPSLFAYQIFMEFRPRLHPAHLLTSLPTGASDRRSG